MNKVTTSHRSFKADFQSKFTEWQGLSSFTTNLIQAIKLDETKFGVSLALSNRSTGLDHTSWIMKLN